MTSVVVPAHNEQRVIARLLTALLGQAEPGEFEVLVVCNGCTDDTAAIAGGFAGVTVLELPEPSKLLALRAGDAAASSFPRLYVDADVVIDTVSARALVAALAAGTVLAVAPERELRLPGSSWAVRAYHRVWAELPAVRTGLFGRGVIGLSQTGYQRVADRPQLLGDDLFVHSRFGDAERRIVPASTVTVYGPRTLGDLLRRRVRAAQGNSELDARAGTSSTGSSSRQLLRLARAEPRLWPSLAVFVTVTVLARWRARRQARTGSEPVWLRDESSRG